MVGWRFKMEANTHRWKKINETTQGEKTHTLFYYVPWRNNLTRSKCQTYTQLWKYEYIYIYKFKFRKKQPVNTCVIEQHERLYPFFSIIKQLRMLYRDKPVLKKQTKPHDQHSQRSKFHSHYHCKLLSTAGDHDPLTITCPRAAEHLFPTRHDGEDAPHAAVDVTGPWWFDSSI